MKKNFLTAAALTVVAFFVATEIAQAADVTFSGQLRTRWEYNEQGTNATNTTRKFANDLDGDDFIATRVRLNANVNVNDSTSAFIQMQSNRTWGNDLNSATTGAGGGSGNASFTPSDGDASVGLHQAYFTLKNFATLPADLKLGRQEVVIDGHRLFGHTGWTTGAQTHDAIRLTHKHGNHTLTYAYILGAEDDRGNTEDNFDVDVHLLHANFQGILGGNLSVYGVASLDECGVTATTACSGTDNNIYTVGFRQAGQLFGIDYRGEYYYQGGDAIADATATSTLKYGSGAGLSKVDRDAYMFGVRIGKKFNNVAMKPSLTVWYDQLSGTDDGDIDSGDWGGFNTLFDTGHKFYGHMDLFLSNVNHGTQGLGLTDLAVKASIQPMPGWTVKADWHKFTTEVDPSSNPKARSLAVTAGVDDDLGTELDLSIHHAYNANTKISAGWSRFAAANLFNLQNDVSANSADWAYIMFDVKF
ncbi:MAG: alginate export family protein [Nitrospina sp.]|jgi:hypothetical protein|nr:alginate export family protein [Nitrospina sp.]MBT5633501.1 alginate export family protein [Nitrospina sp.]